MKDLLTKLGMTQSQQNQKLLRLLGYTPIGHGGIWSNGTTQIKVEFRTTNDKEKVNIYPIQTK
jgi:hypothetical protein